MWLYLYLLNTYKAWTFFRMFLSHVNLFVSKMSAHVLHPFLNKAVLLLLSFEALCIYRILVLCYVVCKYFSPICSLPFHFIDHFLAVQKLLSLTHFHLFILAFTTCAFGVFSKKFCLPMISSSNLIMSGYRFKFLLHVELIFVLGESRGLVSCSASKYPIIPTMLKRSNLSLSNFQFFC